MARGTPARTEPGCRAAPGAYRPAVDVNRCEGKAACVDVCPHDVFEIGRIPDEAFHAMPALLKLKMWAHGRKTAFTPHADACRACGLCVSACPEGAIQLVEAAPAAAG